MPPTADDLLLETIRLEIASFMGSSKLFAAAPFFFCALSSLGVIEVRARRWSLSCRTRSVTLRYRTDVRHSKRLSCNRRARRAALSHTSTARAPVPEAMSRSRAACLSVSESAATWRLSPLRGGPARARPSSRQRSIPSTPLCRTICSRVSAALASVHTRMAARETLAGSSDWCSTRDIASYTGNSSSSACSFVFINSQSP
mmetsp:Transcript_16165/g.50825  ORF Transcript_16165/g.50825 Transcript_16165/m.50825 type:complete len:201 (+) Transcript_16165:86-688(+)